MTGRFDNQKVGYFTNPLLSFSDAQQRTDKTQYITRWRMEPKPEDREAYLKGQMVEPAKPIVFTLIIQRLTNGVRTLRKVLRTGRLLLKRLVSRMRLSPRKSRTVCM